MNNRQVAHAWAGQQKISARGSHFFFEGASIFSYSYNFEIARIMPKILKNKTIYQGAGIQVVLFTTRDYSRTTSRHKTIALRAVSGRALFHAPRVDISGDMSRDRGAHELNVKHYVARAKEAHEKARAALAHGKLYGAQEARYIEEGAAYLDYFNPKFISKEARAAARELRAMDRKRRTSTLWTAAEMETLNAREERAKVNADKRYAARAAKWARQEEERRAAHMLGMEDARKTLELWTRGEGDALPSYSYERDFPTALRIKDKRVETSRGAVVTLRSALELWRLMGLGHGDGAPVLGYDVDGFKVTKWDGDVITIGCHELKRDELARLARVLGVGE